MTTITLACLAGAFFLLWIKGKIERFDLKVRIYRLEEEIVRLHPDEREGAEPNITSN